MSIQPTTHKAGDILWWFDEDDPREFAGGCDTCEQAASRFIVIDRGGTLFAVEVYLDRAHDIKRHDDQPYNDVWARPIAPDQFSDSARGAIENEVASLENAIAEWSEDLRSLRALLDRDAARTRKDQP